MALRVLFVCGSLDQRTSGVADYIILLAKELVSKGVECSCISIFDTQSVGAREPVPNRSRSNGIDYIRISSTISWRDRKKFLLAEVISFRPDWISLQYVPYAYNIKGLPFGLINCVSTLKSFAYCHVMVHELWVDAKASLKSRILSSIQKQIAIKIFSSLSPKIVHTSNSWYQLECAHIGVKCDILPLFSSISFSPLPFVYNPTIKQWSFVLFGSINRDWNPSVLLPQIEVARKHCSVDSCKFLAVGNIGEYGSGLWDSLQSSSFPAFEFEQLGELTVEEVSEQFQRADFGISVAPSHLIDKSSSTAAMLSHGLPVIISRLSPDSSEWNHQLKQSGKYILLDSAFVDSMANARKSPPRNNLVDTAEQFLYSLKNHS